MADVKAKKEGVRLMGFGHRVYKNYDPRAIVMKGLVQEVLGDLGMVDPLLEVAMELERVATSDEYFIKRKLYPNVDYYSGIMLRALGIPTSMFTVMFAMSRTVGWVSQWNEMLNEGQMRIGRPRQLYCGQAERAFNREQSKSIGVEGMLLRGRAGSHLTTVTGYKDFSTEQAEKEEHAASSFLMQVPAVNTR